MGECPPSHHFPRENMSMTRSLDDADQRWASIHQWQANVIERSTENQFPLAAHCYGLIIQLYQLVLKLLCFEKHHDINQRRIKRAFETLILWGQQYGVSIGELDKLIDQSRRLRRSVLRTLTSIGRTLTDRLTPRIQRPLPEQLLKASSLLRKARERVVFISTDNVETEDVSERSSDDDSDTSSVFEVDSLSEIAEDLASNVENLMDLDALYDAAKDNSNIYEKEPVAMPVADVASGPVTAAKVYTEMIRMRFPEADHELLDYLGRANYHRFVRGSRQREENERQAETNAETEEHHATTVIGSKFHDSGIGTSVYTSNYAETVMSFHHKNGSVVKIPPLPQEGKQGLPFSCIACEKKVIISSNKAWKRHLLSDLEPYNCLETSCRNTVSPFSRREDWVEHLAVHHGYGDQWQSLRCSLCLEETGQGEANVTIHFDKHLQDIALAALPTNADDEPDPDFDVNSNSSDSDTNAKDPLSVTKSEATDTPDKYRARSMSNSSMERTASPDRQPSNAEHATPLMSSYWTVQEAAEFPILLSFYGSDWASIAAHMRTKSEVMVKNYYLRRKDGMRWEAIVQEADAKKARGKQTSDPNIDSHNTRDWLAQKGNDKSYLDDGNAPESETSIRPEPSTTGSNIDRRFKDKPFKCAVNGCPRGIQGFTTALDLDRHKRSLHPHHWSGKRYMCQIGPCKEKIKIWPRGDNFKAHLRRVHNLDVVSEEELKTYELNTG
ncbi:hypothetical protein F5B22DRAFT_617983 [Xylaria bambusicola]|uniref:uncharacterized protein n=1 Tax=Xylaria bambusicola TaxID=326684 RepID=UPI002007264E|nr:uncharacterized protein F5B22DRAFT_617983 [Xylaria bambusicola]KAI0509181.1 hypothetical protein F5B22DRAFT_617983 [Xylaria bambusicola]